MRRSPWLIVSLLALTGVLVLGAFPVRAYLDQLAQREALAARAQALTERNRALAEQAQRLETDEAIEQLARDRYQLVRPGEEAYTILPVTEPSPPAAPDVVAGEASRPSWWSRAWARITSIF